MIVDLWIPGVPVAQGSKRHVGGGRMIESNDATLRPWRHAVALEAAIALGRGAEATRDPVTIDLVFAFPRPAGHFGTGRNAGALRSSAPAHKTTKPDVDKLIRAVLDALTGVVWVDDAQVIAVRALKRFGPAGVSILVEFATESSVEGIETIAAAS